MPHRPFFCFQSALFIPPRPLHSRAIVCPWNPVGPLYSRRPLHFGQMGRLLRANFTADARRPARGQPGRCWAGGPSTSCSLIDNDILYSSSCHFIDFCWRFSSVDGTYIYIVGSDNRQKSYRGSEGQNHVGRSLNITVRLKQQFVFKPSTD